MWLSHKGDPKEIRQSIPNIFPPYLIDLALHYRSTEEVVIANHVWNSLLGPDHHMATSCVCVVSVVSSVASWLKHPTGNLDTQVDFLAEPHSHLFLSCVDFCPKLTLSIYRQEYVWHQTDSVGFFFRQYSSIGTLSLKDVTRLFDNTSLRNRSFIYHGFVEPHSQKLVKQWFTFCGFRHIHCFLSDCKSFQNFTLDLYNAGIEYWQCNSDLCSLCWCANANGD